uniref:Uncharacterized protein n=1 Tax=Bionectria ochroleuca TaxID=29856 RepID=A0A8H7NIN1_BIOOC
MTCSSRLSGSSFCQEDRQSCNIFYSMCHKTTWVSELSAGLDEICAYSAAGFPLPTGDELAFIISNRLNPQPGWLASTLAGFPERIKKHMILVEKGGLFKGYVIRARECQGGPMRSWPSLRISDGLRYSPWSIAEEAR